MANIKNELNQIKNAIYGKEVRGSIHDGIDKINNESEESKGKANEAYGVMESIMEEGFDNAVLEANFEQKLDNKIGELQPEWTEFKDQISAQLAETDEQVIRNSDYTGITAKEMYKREIILELPMRFPDYLTVMQGYTDYIHPQAFCVLEEDNLLFILYVPYDHSNMLTNWIVVYDWETGEYDRCFEVNSNGWEGIVVKYEGYERYLYVGNENEEGTFDLRKYNITNLPNNLQTLTDYIQFDIGVDHRFNYFEGLWIFSEVSDTSVLGKGRRSLLKIMNDEFEIVKVINISGSLKTLLARNGPFPKVQGLTITKNNIVFSLGAAATNNNNIISRPDLQQGIIAIDFDGNITKEGMLDNKLLQDFYDQIGYTPTKLENEGVWTSEKNEIYSLNVLQNMNSEESGNHPRGLLIIKEGANSHKTTDFSRAGIPVSSINTNAYIGNYFPVTKGEYIHPITQEVFRTIEEMIQFAREYELPELNVYISGNEEIKGINGRAVRYVYYSFFSANGETFFGLEYSQQGIRHVISSSNGTNYRNIVNKINVLDGPKTITLNDTINISANLDFFETIEFVMQPNGFNNEVHAFKLKGRDQYEIRTFNMSDSSDEVIAFMEIAFERVANGIKLYKYNRHTFTGVSNSDKNINSSGSLTVAEINVF